MAELNYRLNNNNGFSLLELIISVAILSIGITVILQALAFSSRMAGLSCDITDVVFLAEDKIQELEFKEKQDLIQEELISDRNGKFDWEYGINLDPALNLYKLNLKVNWQKLGRKEELNLNTYLRK